ncbi:MAG: hypothetical protein U0Z75_07785 [Deinococcaceae bacterium]
MDLLIPLNPLERLIGEARLREVMDNHGTLVEPSAQDDRWAGLATYILGDPNQAQVLLNRSLARGEQGALIELAAISREKKDLTDAQEKIHQALQESLPLADKVRAWREQGEIHRISGNVEQAIATLEKARGLLQGLPDFHRQWLGSSVAQRLAFIESERGFDLEAQRYLDEALRLIQAPVRRISVLLTRIFVATFAGNYDQANQDVRTLQEETPSDTLQDNYGPTFHYVLGRLLWAQGLLEKAFQHLEQSAQMARHRGNLEQAAFSYLNAGAVQTALGQTGLSRVHIQRAYPLLATPSLKAMMALREGNLAIKEDNWAKASERLQESLSIFQALEMYRESGWAYLHLTYAFLKNGDEKSAHQALESCADMAHRLQNPHFLAAEWYLIPDVQALTAIVTPYTQFILPVASVSPSESAPVEVVENEIDHIELITLGRTAILINGKPASVSLSRIYELLAFLLLNPNSSLDHILVNLFPNEPQASGQRYFHQIKNRLHKDLPQLHIVYNRNQNTYTLDSGPVQLTADVHEIQDQLRTCNETNFERILNHYGAFMQSSNSEWVEEIRDSLEWLLIRSGLKVLQTLFDQKSFAECKRLSTKILEIVPFDITLNELLISATAQLEGILAARSELLRAEHRFAEVGGLPESLKSLEARLQELIN